MKYLPQKCIFQTISFQKIVLLFFSICKHSIWRFMKILWNQIENSNWKIEFCFKRKIGRRILVIGYKFRKKFHDYVEFEKFFWHNPHQANCSSEAPAFSGTFYRAAVFISNKMRVSSKKNGEIHIKYY